MIILETFNSYGITITRFAQEVYEAVYTSEIKTIFDQLPFNHLYDHKVRVVREMAERLETSAKARSAERDRINQASLAVPISQKNKQQVLVFFRSMATIALKQMEQYKQPEEIKAIEASFASGFALDHSQQELKSMFSIISLVSFR